jgi:hypothetical protein
MCSCDFVERLSAISMACFLIITKIMDTHNSTDRSFVLNIVVFLELAIVKDTSSNN